MPVPDPADPRPDYEQIAGDVREGIRSGRYPAGSRLPAQEKLREQYGGVSRGTIREATSALRREGLIVTSTKGMLVMAGGVRPKLPDLADLARRVEALEEDVRRLKADRNQP